MTSAEGATPVPPPPAPAPASSPGRPPRLDVVETVYQTALLSVRRSVRGPRLVVALALVLFPLLLSVPVSMKADPRAQEEFFYWMLAIYHFGIAVPAVALALATAFPWPEADEGTLTFWFTSPVRRWAVHLGRFLAAWIVGTVVLPLGVAAIAAPLDTLPTAALRSVAVTSVSATLLAFPAYLALFWLVATLFRRGLALGVLFVLAENFMSLVPSNLVLFTLIHYVRSMVRPAVPPTSVAVAEKILARMDPATPGTAATVFVVVTVASVVLSLLLVEWIEYRGKTSQAT